MKSTQLSLSLLHLEMGNQQHHLHSSTTPHLYIPSWLYFHLYSPISYPCNIRTNMNITQTCMHAFIHPHQRHIDHPILLFPPMHIHSQLTKINNTNQNGNTSWFVALWSLSLSLSLSPTDRENKETKSTFMGFAGIRLHYNIPALPEILREKEIERGGEGGREREIGSLLPWIVPFQNVLLTTFIRFEGRGSFSLLCGPRISWPIQRRHVAALLWSMSHLNPPSQLGGVDDPWNMGPICL